MLKCTTKYVLSSTIIDSSGAPAASHFQVCDAKSRTASDVLSGIQPKPRQILASCGKPYRTGGGNKKPCVFPRSRLRFTPKAGSKVGAVEDGFEIALQSQSRRAVCCWRAPAVSPPAAVPPPRAGADAKSSKLDVLAHAATGSAVLSLQWLLAAGCARLAVRGGAARRWEVGLGQRQGPCPAAHTPPPSLPCACGPAAASCPDTGRHTSTDHQ